jgi:hypothetical protein
VTFTQYVAKSRKLQRNYIAAEKQRIAKLEKAWLKYVAASHALNLHPLTSREICDRKHELSRMASEVDERYGDTPSMRAAYEIHNS